MKKNMPVKRKRGGQPGNKNAKGHGAPLGNKNAFKHGLYSYLSASWFTRPHQPDEMKRLEQAQQREAEHRRIVNRWLISQGYRIEELEYISVSGYTLEELRRGTDEKKVDAKIAAYKKRQGSKE